MNRNEYIISGVLLVLLSFAMYIGVTYERTMEREIAGWVISLIATAWILNIIAHVGMNDE